MMVSIYWVIIVVLVLLVWYNYVSKDELVDNIVRLEDENEELKDQLREMYELNKVLVQENRTINQTCRQIQRGRIKVYDEIFKKIVNDTSR
jgi:hypothetical protein